MCLILRFSYPFKIICIIVLPVPVFMIDLLLEFWIWQERKGNKTMNSEGFFAIFIAKIYRQITRLNRKRL